MGIAINVRFTLHSTKLTRAANPTKQFLSLDTQPLQLQVFQDTLGFKFSKIP